MPCEVRVVVEVLLTIPAHVSSRVSAVKMLVGVYCKFFRSRHILLAVHSTVKVHGGVVSEHLVALLTSHMEIVTGRHFLQVDPQILARFLQVDSGLGGLRFTVRQRSDTL